MTITNLPEPNPADRNDYITGREKIEISHWSDIPNLPWHGNAWSDLPLYRVVKRHMKDKGPQYQKLCNDLACWYMTGEEPFDDSEYTEPAPYGL